MFYVLGLIVFVILVFVGWRFMSKRHELPCPAWLGWMVELDNPIFRNISASSIVKNADVAAGMRVLDFGCGPGRVTIPLAKVVGDDGLVVAYDIQDGMLWKVRQKAEKEFLTNIQIADAAKYGELVSAKKFNRIFMSTVLGEIPNQNEILSNLYNILTDDGVLSITETVADPHFISKRWLEKLLHDNGFAKRDFFGFSMAYTTNFVKAPL